MLKRVLYSGWSSMGVFNGKKLLKSCMNSSGPRILKGSWAFPKFWAWLEAEKWSVWMLFRYCCCYSCKQKEMLINRTAIRSRSCMFLGGLRRRREIALSCNASACSCPQCKKVPFRLPICTWVQHISLCVSFNYSFWPKYRPIVPPYVQWW